MNESTVESPSHAGRWWSSAGISHQGCKRTHNEDALMERPDLNLWVVADGMGGYEAGDVASQMVIAGFDAMPECERMSQRVDFIEQQMLQVHKKLQRLGEERGTICGSTLMVLLGDRRHAVIMWAGDSRAYLFRKGGFRQISQDHSYVQDLLQRGEISAAEAESHPQANVITRAVGASGPLYVDMEIFDVEDGDTFLLCSDGLDKELSASDMENMMAGGEVGDIAQKLLDCALERGARDNVTVQVVRYLAHG